MEFLNHDPEGAAELSALFGIIARESAIDTAEHAVDQEVKGG